mmetsp:Transcript_29779/g.42503  ORF Transcript_29779/g.42503 Transcript_29779/m.42503 type:complete len:444 (-) Transcript_29779:111-1442(-)
MSYEFKIVLFYKYISFSENDQDIIIERLNQSCNEMGVLGRVLIANEGLNGTLAGKSTYIDKLCETIEFDFGVGKVDWKFSECTGFDLPFLNLSIRKVKELVSSGSTSSFIQSNIGFDPTSYGGISGTGKHLTASEFHSALSNKTPNDIILDIRNQFEHDIGHFEGSIGLGTTTYAETFSALDKTLSILPHQPCQSPSADDTHIYMYCTGGIRCEKASAYLCAKGYKNVYQLQGGIHRYLEAYPDGGMFHGKNFVFDSRVAVGPHSHSTDDINNDDEKERLQTEVVGRCLDCSIACDHYSGKHVCTVCRMPVLICSSCVSINISRQIGRTVGEFHCQRHRDLKDLYFTDLKVFNQEELQLQRDGLSLLLHETLKIASQRQCEGARDVELVGSKLLCVSKNRRRTIRRQLDKIQKTMEALQSSSSAMLSEHINPNDRVGTGFWKQ